MHARLTFNPYFEWQLEQIGGVLDAAAAVPPILDVSAPTGLTRAQRAQVACGNFDP